MLNSEQFARPAKENFLVRHTPRQAHTVHGHHVNLRTTRAGYGFYCPLGFAGGLRPVLRDQRGGVPPGAAGGVQLMVAVALDDFGVREVGGRHLGKPHHQHRPDGKVGHQQAGL
ncbi:MAG: hypothetical protein LW819_11605, partial [Fimbriimonadaceae bacterium]|nr:hypothetical protein [Fimbriimonadaceae bacterium]